MSDITFKNPPINEVVFGVTLDSEGFDPTFYGDFYSEVSQKFPEVHHKPPIQNYNIGTSDPFNNKEFFPRSWFVSKGQDRLIQFQPTKFLYNWRKIPNSNNSYPRYETLYKEFKSIFNQFHGWTKRKGTGYGKVTNLELTYVNHISKEHNWSGPSDYADLIKFLNFSGFSSGSCEAVATSASLLDPRVGVLQLTTKEGTLRNGHRVLVFELTVKKSFDTQNLDDWFLEARNFINNTFVDSTTEKAHQLWKKD